jgi:5-formyltetrahydrofolate cyclo-ligase
VNKYKLRSKILKVRKKNSNKNLRINLSKFFSFLKINKLKSKNIGGYFPSNFEIDDLKILEMMEKKNFNVSLPVIKENNQMNFLQWSINDPLKINKFGIPEPISVKDY